ncbi:MAG: hypothetical protein ABII82_01985 [Verrucomicrobiota bacterium]
MPCPDHRDWPDSLRWQTICTCDDCAQMVVDSVLTTPTQEPDHG